MYTCGVFYYLHVLYEYIYICTYVADDRYLSRHLVLLEFTFETTHQDGFTYGTRRSRQSDWKKFVQSRHPDILDNSMIDHV